MAYPDFLIDKRVLKRHIQKGLVDRSKHEKGLSKLPDQVDNFEYCGQEEEEPEASDAEATSEAGEGATS